VSGFPATKPGIFICRYAINHIENLCAGFVGREECSFANQNIFAGNYILCHPKNPSGKVPFLVVYVTRGAVSLH
jgi:hypothetical protein